MKIIFTCKNFSTPPPPPPLLFKKNNGNGPTLASKFRPVLNREQAHY